MERHPIAELAESFATTLLGVDLKNRLGVDINNQTAMISTFTGTNVEPESNISPSTTSARPTTNTTATANRYSTTPTQRPATSTVSSQPTTTIPHKLQQTDPIITSQVPQQHLTLQPHIPLILRHRPIPALIHQHSNGLS